MNPTETLRAELRRINTFDSILSVLGWDEQVNLPRNSSARRGEQMALLAGLRHEAATSSALGAAIAALEAKGETVSDDEKVLRRYARKDFDRAALLPKAFVEEKAVLDTEAFQAWADAKKRADFPAFAPFLKRQLAMAKQEAAYLGAQNPYDYMLDKFDPGLTTSRLEVLFSDLKRELVPFVAEITAKSRGDAENFLSGIDEDKQRSFARLVTETVGFDYTRGRLDTSLHPFCSGDAADTRMTTRFNRELPLDSLFSSLHETGHALYEQGLPIAELGMPLGQAVGMAIHESQSRLWENQVGRGRAFWKFFEPKLREAFAPKLEGLSSEKLYRAINRVGLTPIRTESDEVTYNLHVILRFELEKALFSGALAVEDLPGAWRKLAKEMLGLELRSDAEGVLQDTHWSGGAFGYFPSYTVGNMIAAQLWYAALEALPGLESDFERGDFSRLLRWLRENVHRHGRRFETEELVVQVTGEGISSRYLMRYLRERYEPIYRV